MKTFIIFLFSLALLHNEVAEARIVKKNLTVGKSTSSKNVQVLLSKARKLEEKDGTSSDDDEQDDDDTTASGSTHTSGVEPDYHYVGSQSEISEDPLREPLLGALEEPEEGFVLAPQRDFIKNKKIKSNQYHNQFTVMQFNMLAKKLSTDFDSHVAYEEEGCVTLWENRKDHVFLEIARYFPDIVGLQEMDVLDDLQDYFSDDFHIHRFLRKNKGDGPTIMFRKFHFTLTNKVELKLLDENGKQMTQVALLLVLQDLRVDNHFVIAVCAHLKSDKNDMGEQARYSQVEQIQQALTQLKHDTAELHQSATIAIVWTMDLNGDSTGYYEVVKKKQVSAEVFADYEQRLVRGNVGIIQPYAYYQLFASKFAQALNLHSAYRTLDPQSVMSRDPVLAMKCEDEEVPDSKFFTRAKHCHPSKEPEWTTSKSRNSKRVTMAIDYIIYGEDELVPLGVAEIPDQDEMFSDDRQDELIYLGLPSWTYPSDHIALVANMAYRK